MARRREIDIPAPLRMIRGVSQLLFTYLPGRTVDWEDGLAIVQLGNVALSDAWSAERAEIILREIGQLLDRWRNQGGTVDPLFPDPSTSSGRFTVGQPIEIDATILPTGYLCRSCQALTFPRGRDLASEADSPLTCQECGAGTLRQFGQVFVHGCGELAPVQEFIPWSRSGDDGNLEPVRRPLRCGTCADGGVLEIPSGSERVSDLKIVCRSCQTVVLERFTARCRQCTIRVGREPRDGEGAQPGSPVARIAMRMSRYSANDTYYPQTVTLLRLDRPAMTTEEDPEQRELRGLLPLDLRPERVSSTAEIMAALSTQLRRAEQVGDATEQHRLLARIASVATRPCPGEPSDEIETPPQTASDVIKDIRESLAFRTTVNRRAATDLVLNSAAGEPLAKEIRDLQRALGLRDIEFVDDLPVINATFGYTRRSFNPTYDELGAAGLPTEIRVFPSISNYAANRLARQDLVGTIPILAREGEHQGLFLSLEPVRVMTWLRRNGVDLGIELPTLTEILTELEPIDRYYDGIWECPIRRLVFGLVHSLSHAAMRAASWFSGLERTSLSEYIFLPLLGTVIFDTSGAFQLGGVESLVRDHLIAFLEALTEEALTCVYDADCIDGRGACHGCIHSPEIGCRVFNHGLSRSFLVGGHIPWQDVSTEGQLVGYWQLG